MNGPLNDRFDEHSKTSDVEWIVNKCNLGTKIIERKNLNARLRNPYEMNNNTDLANAGARFCGTRGM